MTDDPTRDPDPLDSARADLERARRLGDELLVHVIGAGACWCGYSIEDFQAGGLTHPEAADRFEGIRRHIARFDCGHVQPFLQPPILGWADWCEECSSFRWVIGGCSCSRFEQVAS